MKAVSSQLLDEFRAVVGERGLISSPEELRTYECDGLTHGRTRPDLVVLPGSTEEVAEVVRIARAADGSWSVVPDPRNRRISITLQYRD